MKKKSVNGKMIEEKYDGLYYTVLAVMNLADEMHDRPKLDEVDRTGLLNPIILIEDIINEHEDENNDLLLAQVKTCKFILKQPLTEDALDAVFISMGLLALIIENL